MEELAQRVPRPGRDGAARAHRRRFWLALAGVVVAWFFYLRRPDIPAAIQRRFALVYTLLDNKYYMDWFNENVLAARRAPGSARACGRAATSA